MSMHDGFKVGNRVKVRDNHYENGINRLNQTGVIVKLNDLHYGNEPEARVDFGDKLFNPKQHGDAGWIPIESLRKVSMNPPYRVLARVGRSRKAYWLIWREMISAFVDEHSTTYRADSCRPVEHPQNDKEALAIIEQAKTTRR